MTTLERLINQSLTEKPVAFKAFVKTLQIKMGAGWGTSAQAIAGLIRATHHYINQNPSIETTWDDFGNSYVSLKGK